MIQLNWSLWIRLEADLETYKDHVPKAAGFYRVRAIAQQSLVYIGQTGRSLRQRTRTEFFTQLMHPILLPT